jgi:hypothetical protein
MIFLLKVCTIYSVETLIVIKFITWTWAIFVKNTETDRFLFFLAYILVHHFHKHPKKQSFSFTNRRQETFTWCVYLNTDDIVNNRQLVFVKKNCKVFLTQRHFNVLVNCNCRLVFMNECKALCKVSLELPQHLYNYYYIIIFCFEV